MVMDILIQLTHAQQTLKHGTAPEQQRFVHDDDLDDIINDEDLCPLDPEDYDGDRDLDGCPDP
jgi:hypothetical protein